MLKSTEAERLIMTAIQCLQDARENDRNERGKYIYSVFELEVVKSIIIIGFKEMKERTERYNTYSYP